MELQTAGMVIRTFYACMAHMKAEHDYVCGRCDVLGRETVHPRSTK